MKLCDDSCVRRLHSDENARVLGELCGAGSDAGMVLQRAPTEHQKEGVTMMKGTLKANLANKQSHSEPSSQHQSGALMLDLAGPETGAPTDLERSTPGPYLDSPPCQRTLTPVLPGKFKPTYHMTRANRKLQDWFFRGRKASPELTTHSPSPTATPHPPPGLITSDSAMPARRADRIASDSMPCQPGAATRISSAPTAPPGLGLAKALTWAEAMFGSERWREYCTGWRSVEEYTLEFRTLAAEVDWMQDALCAAYVNGLSDQMKDKLFSRDDPQELNDLITLALQIDARLQACRPGATPGSRPFCSSLLASQAPLGFRRLLRGCVRDSPQR
ncbi:hypothetical protein L3Q82_009185 [Scortum barcoo]|uniref:Uncharacterized protein n=1 Tax=Scortum barcoo TaxID=214431 RepID=A0ACB8WFM8_9TELE|nr:hypothetical protein L3Q82_009185 [Scortum barcoo]